jgi:hypothetical protein
VLNQPAHAKPTTFQQFWAALATNVLRLLANKAHCNVTITLKNGTIQNVRFDQSFLPGDVPPV